MTNSKLKIVFIVIVLAVFIGFPFVILALSKSSKSSTTSSGRARSTTRNRRATPRPTVIDTPPIVRDPWNVDPAPSPQPGPLDTPPRPRDFDNPFVDPAPYFQPRNFNTNPVPQPNRNIRPPPVLESFPVGTRPVVSPERISASYVKPVETLDQSREVTPGTSAFSLLFKGIKNFDKIPEKHRNHLALVLTPEELADPAYKATLDAELARDTVLILQIDSELRQAIVGDPEFYAQYLTTSVMEFAEFPGKIEYWMLPEGYDYRNSTIKNCHYIRRQDVKFVESSSTVTSSSVHDEFKDAVLVDISGDDAEAVIENLDVQLDNCGQTNYPLCDFTNKWNVREVVNGSMGIDAFRSTLHNFIHSYDPTVNLYVSRNNLFQDSFNALKVNDFSYFKSPRFRINFNGELGADAGGLRAEWFNLMSRELFKPETGLFLATATNQSIYYPDPQSFKKQDYLLLYKFAGCFIARCIIEQIPIGVHLSRSMYKRILGLKPDFEDLKEIDEELHRTLSQIAENPVSGGMAFTAFEIDLKDPAETVALKPNGGDEMLSDENKDEYIALYTNYKLIFEAEQQVEAFMSGFNYMIPAENIVGKLSVDELDALIAGAGEIDVEDWKRNIEYHGYDANSQQIIWFWELVDELTDAERRQLLRLATGSTGVPAEGFAGLRTLSGPRKYGIHNTYNSIGWPAGHTCFNYFDLPRYENRELFMQMMRDAIKDENMTFTSA